MLKYLYRSTQGALFGLVIGLAGGTFVEGMLAFMVGVSFDPRHFWWFL